MHKLNTRPLRETREVLSIGGSKKTLSGLKVQLSPTLMEKMRKDCLGGESMSEQQMIACLGIRG